MKFVEELRKKDHLVSAMGVRARERARKAGASSFYFNPNSDDVIIEEKPDGTLIRHPEADGC